MYQLIKIIIVSAIIGTTGCASKSIIGNYSNIKHGRQSFYGKELILNENGTFKFNEWTDNYSISTDENGEIDCGDIKGKGTGTYRITQDTIEFYFTNNDFIICQLEIEVNDYSYQMDIELEDELHEPLEATTISLLSNEADVIVSGLTNDKGKLTLTVDKKQSPKNIIISTFGANDLVIDIADNSGRKTFQIKRCLGYYSKGHIERVWFEVKRNSLTYKKTGGKKVRLQRLK